jgi:prepilin-type N-terminal cleavage/methylation domain-containing protein
MSRRAFSLVEMLVAAAIGAVVITAAVIGFAVISGASTRGGRVDVQLPGAMHANFFGAGSSYVTVWPNPNYSEAAKARLLRDKLMEDVSASTAVFCLGRDGVGGVRPAQITITSNEWSDLRACATAAEFRELLIDNGVAGAGVFVENQSGPLAAVNASIFLLGGLESATNNTLRMVATYEIDFVTTSSPAGVYASVRRYDVNSGTIPTDYYQVFYPGEDNDAVNGFRPLVANFGRQAAGGTYNIAPNHPFTFLWWPDPLVSTLEGPAVSAAGGTPLRSAYSNMAGRTSLFTVVPVFPGQ